MFLLRRLSEKFRAKNCFFISDDLEKAFDWVTKEIICFALRRKGALEYLVNWLCLFIKVVKLLSQLMGNYQVYFK